MYKVLSKQVLSETETEGIVEFNGNKVLTFYRDEEVGTTVYYGEDVVGDGIEEIDGVNGWDIVENVIDLIS